MGAEVTVYCKVLKTHEELVEVQAVTLQEAADKASRLPGVSFVTEVSYLPGVVET